MTGLLHKPKNSARQWASKEQAASLLGADTFCQRILAASLLNGMARLMRCITDWKHLIAIIFITSTFKLHQPIPSRPSLPTPIRPGSWQTLYTCWKIPHHFIRALYSLLLLPQPLLAAFFKTQRRSISLITVFFLWQCQPHSNSSGIPVTITSRPSIESTNLPSSNIFSLLQRNWRAASCLNASKGAFNSRKKKKIATQLLLQELPYFQRATGDRTGSVA